MSADTSPDLSPKEQLRLLAKRAIHRKQDGARIIREFDGSIQEWLLDVRSVLLTPDFLPLAARIFWETYADAYPFQVGGLETVAIALVAAIVMEGASRGKPVNGFYIRKARKHYGLQKAIEGALTDAPIILIDDIINSGGSFIKQIEILKREGRRVAHAFAFVRYRDERYSLGDGITLTTLFSPQELGLDYPIPRYELPEHDAFTVVWAVRSPGANFFYRLPKSAPVIDEKKVYAGFDTGIMRALDQRTGAEVWKFKIYGFGAKGKTIFSSPALWNDTIFFGAYDGTFYALDANTGKRIWIYLDADWIGSSPAIADELGLVFVGLEYGLWNKRGGIVALDARTGKKRWEYVDMPAYTHGSPAYSERYNLVAIGSNNGTLYAFQAKSGKLLWQYQTGGDIKSAPAFDEKLGCVVFGSFDGRVYVLDCKTGQMIYSYETGAGIYSIPCVRGGRAYVSSLDKRIYCFDLRKRELLWKFETGGRVFSSPLFAGGMLYVGSNDGRFYEIDPETGRNTSYFQTTERITNKAAYDPRTKRFFVPTYANEIYCIEKRR